MALAIGLWGMAVPSAHAHPQYSPTRSNRYLKLSLSGGGTVRVSWSLLVGETPAVPVRRAADANGDQRVDERELAGYAARLARSVTESLLIEVDGARREVAWEEPVVGLSDGRVGPLPFSVDLVGQLPVPGRGPHLVRLDDATPIEDLGETEIRIDEGPGTRVLAAWQGREDAGHVLRHVWNGPRFSSLEDRSVGFRFVDDRLRPRWRAPLGLAGALLGAVVAVLLATRARRARRGGA